MHDFAASRTHTILLNLPLTLAPHNLFSTPPVPLIHFDRTLPSEFVVFPRLLRSPETPQEPIHFTESEPSLIFHTANAWDEYQGGHLAAVNMLGCRFKSAKLVYAAGAVEVPKVEKLMGDKDVVRLHYYRFAFPPDYGSASSKTAGVISHSFPLAAIPFEFPTVPPDLGMSASRYVYGCTMSSGSFDERLGGAAKVDCLVKIDVQELIRRGRNRGTGKTMDPVDRRSSIKIMEDWARGVKGPLEIFALPEGWFAQEARFVPRTGDGLSEDEGYLLSYGESGCDGADADDNQYTMRATFFSTGRPRLLGTPVLSYGSSMRSEWVTGWIHLYAESSCLSVCPTGESDIPPLGEMTCGSGCMGHGFLPLSSVSSGPCPNRFPISPCFRTSSQSLDFVTLPLSSSPARLIARSRVSKGLSSQSSCQLLSVL